MHRCFHGVVTWGAVFYHGGMDALSSDSENSPPRARILWTLAKWLLFVVVILAVGYRGWTLWYKVDTKTLQLHYGWLFAAVLLYTAAWVPALIYWRWLMVAVGDKIPVLQVARAYYCGHLGKYVPGKAGVILIRATMIAGAGGKFGRAALTAGYEALTTISTGVAVAVMLAPWIFPGFVKHPDWDWLTSLPGYPYVVPLVGADLSGLSSGYRQAVRQTCRKVQQTQSGNSGRRPNSSDSHLQRLIISRRTVNARLLVCAGIVVRLYHSRNWDGRF